MTLKFTGNVQEINLHVMLNWELNLIEVCAAHSCTSQPNLWIAVNIGVITSVVYQTC